MLNEDQFSLLRWCRWSASRIERVVRDLRNRVQETRRAAGKAALHVPVKAVTTQE